MGPARPGRDGSIPGPGSHVRVLIESSEYWLRNNGDLAMLAVTVGRLRERWPQARIGVLTEVPLLLRSLFPDVEPISPYGARPWREPPRWQALVARSGPRSAGALDVGRMRARVRIGAVVRAVRTRSGGTGSPGPGSGGSELPPGTAAAAQSASLVVALGGGYIADADPGQTRRALALLEHAVDRGVPAVMLGQGLGPLDDPALRRRAASVLPRVDFVGLREGRRGPLILEQLGVPERRVQVTGDDAIELAYEARAEALGSGLGCCLRIASYAPVSRRAQEVVGQVLRRESASRAAPVIPLIISEYRSEDRRATLPIVRGAGGVRPLPRYVRPSLVAQRVARCRTVVTGAYHLAVFALSQGIPVVALTGSRYYDDKFAGLADMFGPGVLAVRLDAATLEQDLRDAVHASWETAPTVREALRARAREQISACRSAVDRVVTLTEQRIEATRAPVAASGPPGGSTSGRLARPGRI